MTQPPENAELAACPFCGGEDIRQQEARGRPHTVYCADCRAGAESVAAWNTRPDPFYPAKVGGEACPHCDGRGGFTGVSAIHGEQDADCGACEGSGIASLSSPVLPGVREDLREAMGIVADRLDNLTAAGWLPAPAHVHLEGLRGGVANIARSIRETLASSEPPNHG